jgi:hypothetical protein
MTTSDAAVPKRATEIADAAAKCGAAAVAILYVLGAIVNTIRYASYGISALNLFRVQYVVAGAWTVLPIVAVGALTHIWQVRNQRGWVRVAPILVLLVGLAAAAAESGMTLIFAVLELVFAFVVFAGICIVLDVLPHVQRVFVVRGDDPLEPGEALGGWFACFLLPFAIYLAIFSGLLYPHIPAFAGGGAPVEVRLSLKPGTAVPPDVAGDHRLLFETDSDYVVEGPEVGVKAFAIPRDAIASVSFLKASHTPSHPVAAAHPAQ